MMWGCLFNKVLYLHPHNKVLYLHPHELPYVTKEDMVDHVLTSLDQRLITLK
jgi:hypothetical protein